MGLAIDTAEFSAQDYAQFSEKVRTDLVALKAILADPGFGAGPASIGAELEFYLIDSSQRVLPRNLDIYHCLNDPQLTVELNRFNLEYNLSPQPFSGSPFSAMEAELGAAINRINQAAQGYQGEVVPIGILPTLRRDDFHHDTMTDIPRYHALSKALRTQRGGPFVIAIEGRESINLEANDVTLEGANTSHQIHWRVPAHAYADYYNAVQLVTPIVLALAANSPGLFGHHLWDETRIALFKQAIDSRAPHEHSWRHPPRVYFGHGWLRGSAWELFAASAALFPPILPMVGEEDPLAMRAQGELPKLEELRLHQGTTWPWNRAIYDDSEGGHLRIEMRALPAGPSLRDMSANTLLYIGCALAVLPDIEHLTAVLPFHYAEHNFYRAAKHGLDARLVWPDVKQVRLHDEPVLEIARGLLPWARQALRETALDEAEVDSLWTVIEGRLDERINGARWQRDVTCRLLENASKEEATRHMLQIYLQNLRSGLPVCEWRRTL